MRKFVIFNLLIILMACEKDKIEIPCPEPIDQWELRGLISGTYKVYDTLGSYLYDMDITHITHPDPMKDSLRFENFDGQFSFATEQFKWANYLMGVSIGSQDTLYDSLGDRWKLSGALHENYNNFNNDTIRLRFQKTNINYWVEDVVPYFACDCKQIAVKQ